MPKGGKSYPLPQNHKGGRRKGNGGNKKPMKKGYK